MVLAVFVTLVLVSGWLVWWIQPERQLSRVQGRLLAMLEKRDFESFGRLIAEDYGDRWRHDKAFVVRGCGMVFSQFLTLTIERGEGSVAFEAGRGFVREKMTLKGFGGPLAMYARDEVNALREPFTMTWRKRGWKPWEWELTSVEHPALVLPQ